MQIYCERVFDLLAPETAHASILIREDPDRGVYLDGASCMSVTSVADCLSLLDQGNANRAVASTGMNAHSSRSHAILILRVERKDFLGANLSTSPSPASPSQMIKMSNLYLVDLAGSERVKKTKVMGRHVNELKAINLSLSALGNCISALSKKQKHVPYRDSKLTRLLQSSLGGNAKTALVITITPAPTEAHETLSTMLFGQRAMQVSVNAHCNVLSVLDYKSLYEDMQQRVDAMDEKARELEYEALEHRSKAAHFEDQLLKAQMRIQHLEFENQAGKAALEATARNADQGGAGLSEAQVYVNNAVNSPILTQQLAELVTKHGQDVNKIKDKCDVQVDTYKRLADQASQEWHEVEDALTSEKLQVLSALQELKEFKLRFFELEEETTGRIAELVQEVKEKERELREAVDGSQAQNREIQVLKKQVRTSSIDPRLDWRVGSDDRLYCEAGRDRAAAQWSAGEARGGLCPKRDGARVKNKCLLDVDALEDTDIHSVSTCVDMSSIRRLRRWRCCMKRRSPSCTSASGVSRQSRPPRLVSQRRPPT